VEQAEARVTRLDVSWHGTGRQPQCPPNPLYPNGRPLDVAGDAPGCTVELAHPAPCVGSWLVVCPVCGLSVAITAAGRADDPSTVRLPCKTEGRA
jgi:hypothetical protein